MIKLLEEYIDGIRELKTKNIYLRSFYQLAFFVILISSMLMVGVSLIWLINKITWLIPFILLGVLYILFVKANKRRDKRK